MLKKLTASLKQVHSFSLQIKCQAEKDIEIMSYCHFIRHYCRF